MEIFVIAGPNGAGKTTATKALLPALVRCEEYLNADAIASSLSPFHPDSVAIQAGKIMLSRMKQLAQNKVTFALEATLAGKSLLRFLKTCQEAGYTVTILFFYLKSSDLAIQRVRDRVRRGGHDIPINIIIRRYKRSLYNFFTYYSPMADNWVLYDNSNNNEYIKLIAKNDSSKVIEIFDHALWLKIQKEVNHENP